MPPSRPKNQIDEDRLEQPEAQLGGADAVEKTTYVVGQGTDPERRKGGGPSATVESRAPAMVVGAIIVLIATVAVAYLIGLAVR